MSGENMSYKWGRLIHADITAAKLLLKPENNPTNDEAVVNLAAYHMQQAVEKSLKAYLSYLYGENEESRAFRIHDITTLAERLETKYRHRVLPYIRENSEEIAKWEASSRYGLSLLGLRDKVEAVMPYAERQLENIRSIEHKLSGNEPLHYRDVDILTSEENRKMLGESIGTDLDEAATY